jgi:hypothetical protein
MGLKWRSGKSLAATFILTRFRAALIFASAHRGVRAIGQPQHQRCDDKLDEHYKNEQQQQHCPSMLLPRSSARQGFAEQSRGCKNTRSAPRTTSDIQVISLPVVPGLSAP